MLAVAIEAIYSRKIQTGQPHRSNVLRYFPAHSRTCRYRTLFPDTHQKMEALIIELWRTASPTRKMQMLAQLNQSARLLATTGLRSQSPKISEAELRRRLAGLVLGEEIACKVYGELPDAE